MLKLTIHSLHHVVITPVTSIYVISILGMQVPQLTSPSTTNDQQLLSNLVSSQK